MRHSILTASLLAALLLSACAQETPTETQVSISPDPIAASAGPEQQDLTDTKLRTTAKLKPAVADTEKSTLPEWYQGLDPTEISRAEIDQLIALEEEVNKAEKEYADTVTAWRNLDASRRGPEPVRKPTLLSLEDEARLRTLRAQFENARIRKKYENYDSNILSAAEIQEIILLEQAQAKTISDFQNKIEAWMQQDPATRGEQPQMESAGLLWGENPRQIELQGKIQSAEEMKNLNQRVNELSEAHNITLSDSEMSELQDLQLEANKFEAEFAKALMEAEKESELTGEYVSEEMAIRKLPKHLIQNMIDIDKRMKTIKAPLEAAERADRIQTKLAELSEESGVPILSGEISETIALTAEKEQIESRTEAETIQKWLDDGGPIPDGMFLPNDEDYARIKEIDARLKAISAPMNDAKNAALEADNPGLRKERLEQEAQQKWRDDWRDRQQAGDVPVGTPMTSPSYAELQDRVQDYGSKLQTRAERVGYSIPETDVTRLDALNEDLLAIRKTVYDKERDGSSHIDGEYGLKKSTFETASGMYKIRLIEKKQRDILAGLSEAETTQEEVFNVDELTNDPADLSFNQYLEGSHSSLESMIEDFRLQDIEISQSDIDELRAFEEELNGR